MPEEPKAKDKPRPGEREDGSRKKAVLIVVLAVVAVLGTVFVLNKDRFLVHSDSTTPTTAASTEPAAPNGVPVIHSLTPATDRIEPFSLCEIVCEAEDPDGDVLAYTWSASAGDIYGGGATIDWGSPVSEGLYRISVQVDDGRGGTEEYSVPLRVQANIPPKFSSMAADTDWVKSGGSTRIACEVADADGDDISLEWTVTGGEIVGEGAAVMWVAPEIDGVYWIAVYARDTYGGEARRTIPLSVSTGEPPKIDGLFLQGVNTDMLRKVGNDWMIYQGRTCQITCAVIDQTASYTYEWSADFGKLTANGAVATWEAPPSRVDATITVLVSDEYGNQSSASVLISVETCTCSF